jgi:hypothetical protein
MLHLDDIIQNRLVLFDRNVREIASWHSVYIEHIVKITVV